MSRLNKELSTYETVRRLGKNPDVFGARQMNQISSSVLLSTGNLDFSSGGGRE
jgi:hypothetical protein